ncbi:MAG: hypothetical protein DRQ44_03425 [Gammaproteobacteria bacterium]|nr:MAG: hypothetical protein DRQ44_03425 [Gammaproteobacteria bacterium]
MNKTSKNKNYQTSRECLTVQNHIYSQGMNHSRASISFFNNISKPKAPSTDGIKPGEQSPATPGSDGLIKPV